MEINGRPLRYGQSTSKLEGLLNSSSSSSKMSNYTYNYSNKCLICQIQDEKSICRPSGISKRVFNSCSRYLHSGITQDSFKNINDKEMQLSLCQSCFESALELNQLAEEVEKFQREIQNVIVTFTLKILHRRGQIKSAKTTKRKVDVDISVLSLNSSQLAQFEKEAAEAQIPGEYYVSQDVPQENLNEDHDGLEKSNTFDDGNAEENWNEGSDLYGGFLPNSEEVEVNEEQLGAPITAFPSYYDTNMHLEPNRVYSVAGSSQMLMRPAENEEYLQEEGDEEYEDVFGEVGDVVEDVKTKVHHQEFKPIIVRHKNNCNKCGKICSTSYNLLLHEKACNGRTRYLACHLCGNTFSKRSALTRHFKAIHQQDASKIRKYQKIFPLITSVSSVAPVVKTEASTSSIATTSSMPQMSFMPTMPPLSSMPTMPPLKLNPTLKKTVMAKSNCRKCGKICSTDYNLTLHERACTGKKTCMPCKLCGKTFNMHSALLRHVRTVHSLERPYKCSACPKRFNRKEFLRNHFNRTHAVSDPIIHYEQVTF